MSQVPYSAPVGLAYSHISSATTTVVKSKPGAISGIMINSASDGAITLYDNTAASGTVMGVITISTPITVPTMVSYGQLTGGSMLTFTTGLTVVTSATCDLTVAFR